MKYKELKNIHSIRFYKDHFVIIVKMESKTEWPFITVGPFDTEEFQKRFNLEIEWIEDDLKKVAKIEMKEIKE